MGPLLTAMLLFGQVAASPSPATVFWTGQHSKITAPEYHAIRNEAEWVRLWSRHQGVAAVSEKLDNRFFNQEGVPIVEFQTHMVVAIFGGSTYNCAGYDLNSVTSETGGLRLRLLPRYFQTAGPRPDGGAQKATPFALFVLPKSDAPISIEEADWERIGQLRGWKPLAIIHGKSASGLAHSQAVVR